MINNNNIINNNNNKKINSISNKHLLQDWILATRPWSFPASIIPLLVSLFYVFFISSKIDGIVYEEINLLNGLLVMVSVILFHSSANLISDYNDFFKGVDRKDTYGSKILTDGLFFPISILKFGFLLFIVASIIGFYVLFTSKSQLALFILGIIAAINVIFYYKFKFKAFGELSIFISFAILPTITMSYVLLNTFNLHLLLISIPIGLITTAILFANNVRDIYTDKRAGIITIAMLLGLKKSQNLYTILILIPFITIILFVIFDILPLTSLLFLLVFPISLKNLNMMRKVVSNGVESIATLDVMTAKLQLISGFILILSLIFAIII